MVDPVLSSGSDSGETWLDAEIAELGKSIKESDSDKYIFLPAFTLEFYAQSSRIPEVNRNTC